MAELIGAACAEAADHKLRRNHFEHVSMITLQDSEYRLIETAHAWLAGDTADVLGEPKREK